MLITDSTNIQQLPNQNNGLTVIPGEQLHQWPTPHSLAAAAHEYRQAGFIPVPAIAQEKRPTINAWTKPENFLLNKQDIDNAFNRPQVTGIGLMTGPNAGNLFVLDIDSKYDKTGTLYERLTSAINEYLPGVLENTRISKTPNKGYHIYGRCVSVGRGQKLACRPATAEEKAVSKNKEYGLIETRADGNFIMCYPTPGYAIIQDSATIPDLTSEQYNTLLEVCRSFNEVIKEPEPEYTPGSGASLGFNITPWDDYNQRSDIKALLENNGFKYDKTRGDRMLFFRPGKTEGAPSCDFHTEKRLFKTFSTSTELEPEKGYTPFKLYAKFYHNGDSSAAAKELLEKGYGSKRENWQALRDTVQYSSGKSKTETIKRLQQHDITEQQAEQFINAYNADAGPEIGTYWNVKHEKIKNEKRKSITINRVKLQRFLTDVIGVYNYPFTDQQGGRFIKIRKEGFIISEISEENIKQAVKNHVFSLPPVFDHYTTPDELYETILKGDSTYFGGTLLDTIDVLTPDFLRDTESTAFFPFQNGIVSVTREGVQLKSYEQVGKHIWKRKVIPFDITLPELDGFSYDNIEFYKFLCCICGNSDPRKLTSEQVEKLFYAKRLIGYTLHKYKDPARPWAVILAEETESDSMGGGTGKGIFLTALSRLMNSQRIDGKNFDPKKAFAWQRVDLDTDLIALEDTRKDLDFEGLYSIITDGMTVEKKHAHEIRIPYADSPKVAITTNYTVKQVAESAKRRQRVLEFFPFFNSSYTPEQFFGHKLFDHWDAAEWNRFYFFMFSNVREYMNEGLNEIGSSEALKRKQVKQFYDEDFLNWWDIYTANGCDKMQPFSSLFEAFGSCTENDKITYTKKRFRKAIHETAQIFGYKVEQCRDKDEKRTALIRVCR